MRIRMPCHIEDFLLGADMLLGVAMALQAPGHVKRFFLPHQRHLVDTSVTRGAANALINVMQPLVYRFLPLKQRQQMATDAQLASQVALYRETMTQISGKILFEKNKKAWGESLDSLASKHFETKETPTSKVISIYRNNWKT